MSPTVFRDGSNRFFFFSREEERMHIHVVGPDGEAKFWIEPVIALANFIGYSPKEIRKLQTKVENSEDEIRRAWTEHFS